MDLGANLSIATLHRYRAQLDLADQLQIAENLAESVAENATDTPSPVDHLRDLYAARPTQLDTAGLQIIKQRALELAASPKTSPSLFKDLHRIFTYEDRKTEKQHTLELRHTQRLELAHLREQIRLQIANQREATRQRQLDLAEKRFALEVRKQEHREKIDAQNAPQKSNIDEARENAEAFLACGREYLRQEREAAAAAQPLNGGTRSPSPTSISRDAIPAAHTSPSRDTTAPCNADKLSASLTQNKATTEMPENQTQINQPKN